MSNNINDNTKNKRQEGDVDNILLRRYFVVEEDVHVNIPRTIFFQNSHRDFIVIVVRTSNPHF